MHACMNKGIVSTSALAQARAQAEAHPIGLKFVPCFGYCTLLTTLLVQTTPGTASLACPMCTSKPGISRWTELISAVSVVPTQEEKMGSGVLMR